MSYHTTVFRFLSRKLYPILGATVSTKLAYSPFGKFVLSKVTGISDFSDKQSFRVYMTDNGIKVKLEPYVAIGSGIMHLGVMNKPETELVEQLLKPGNVVIDIGAYVDGWYTLLSGKLVGTKGHVYSFEPHPEYFKRLVDNISLNKLHNVTAEKLGVSDSKGITTFYEADAGSSLYESLAFRFNQKGSRKIRINTITLDEYVSVKKIRKINLIKIDVEGAEMKVLKKATKILKKIDAPDLIVEVVDAYLKAVKSSEKELVSFLQSFEYKPYIFTSKGLQQYKKTGKRTMMNMLFTKRKDMKKFTIKQPKH